jgi:hypothetical protein
MLTYQLQNRVFRIEGSGSLEFPNQVEIEMKLGPPEAFGTSDDFSRLVLFERKARLRWNANTGRVQYRPKPALEPLDVVIETPTQRLTLEGDILRYQDSCQDSSELEGILSAFQYILPPLLNIGFADPPVVLYTTGRVGNTKFSWEHEEAQGAFLTRTLEGIEQNVVDSFNRLSLMTGTTNRRLAAGLHYFYMASRLIVAGNSQWEFMSESVLNMSKALEVLFGASMDSVREKLSELGYTTEEIEGDFIPLMILRNHFDVGHPRIAILKKKQLRVLYRYLAESEDRFRNLFLCLFEKLTDGTFELQQQGDLRLDSDEQSKLDRLIETIEPRVAAWRSKSA